MKQILIIISLLLLSSLVKAEIYKYRQNSQTGRPDLVNDLSTTTVNSLNVLSSSITINGISYSWPSIGGTSGQCLTTSGGSPQVLTWASCGSGGGGQFVLLEDGVPPTPPAINYALLEDGTYFSLEDNSKTLLEQ